MRHVKVLDCTLRDGAYLIDKNFGDKIITGIINGLLETELDVIEIGFLQDTGMAPGKTVFKNAQHAQEYIPKNHKKTEFAVLADCSRYSIENLEECDGKSFTIVRECFLKHEMKEALKKCKLIKERGYKLFIQPVDIMGYSDSDILQLINDTNKIEPYAISIVDTFGSMYVQDVQRIFNLFHHNLKSEIHIGFHSHNNMQLSNALSQEFVKMSYGIRNVVIDGTISGMGRGAGNTPTELLIQYMVSQMKYPYKLDPLLDIIDTFISNIRTRCSWGYSTPYFIAGCYAAHVNNIAYLLKKSSIKSNDIRFILNQLDVQSRKSYDYDLLEKKYISHIQSEIDDTKDFIELQNKLKGKEILLIMPGGSINDCVAEIQENAKKEDTFVIVVNFIPDFLKSDYVYMNNIKRYNSLREDEKYLSTKKIITSNIFNTENVIENVHVISMSRLIKCGWNNMDNSAIMILRLLDQIGVSKIQIAGFDGYDYSEKKVKHYFTDDIELSFSEETLDLLNRELKEMFLDFIYNKKDDVHVEFFTPSQFENCL